jgi:hypothetical protein
LTLAGLSGFFRLYRSVPEARARRNRISCRTRTSPAPEERKEPLTDARHVRNAIARFDQVEGVTDAERDRARKRNLTAAKRHGVDVSEKSWRDLANAAKPQELGARLGRPWQG